MKYVLAKVVTEKDIRRFMIYYKKVLPEKMSAMDGVVLISVLLMLPGFNINDSDKHYIMESGDMPNIKYEYNIDDCCQRSCSFRIDDTGCIIYFENRDMVLRGKFDCPPIIARLEN